ncbi:MAG: UDP-N-acetylmuramoyl-tripeptide--D-alanyl-D-alanine ligase, partial [Deinococcus-Thermus bacterium]|nr:UDP-N-acetylmuramoyl-tripeptide--D-alanyl-D-alanine ligase [Deinococcota bacterium]
MAFWEADNLRETAGGRWLSRPGPSASMEIRGVSTDTRTLRRGEVFVALRGDRFDGHDHLADATRRGAAIAVVDRDVAAPAGCGVIRVEDTYTALGRLAASYRRTLAAEVIAITGSVGKTTTKHMLHTVLASALRGSASPRSYNNRVGVPLSMLAADPGDRYLIVEVGSNAPGEVGALGRLVEPDVAVITHIAQAHLEGLGTLEGIAREKAGLLRHLKDDGLAIVNGDAPALGDHLKALRRVVR